MTGWKNREKRVREWREKKKVRKEKWERGGRTVRERERERGRGGRADENWARSERWDKKWKIQGNIRKFKSVRKLGALVMWFILAGLLSFCLWDLNMRNKNHAEQKDAIYITDTPCQQTTNPPRKAGLVNHNLYKEKNHWPKQLWNCVRPKVQEVSKI